MRTYVWCLPTRLFHGMLVVLVLLALLTSESDAWLDWHAAIGYGVGMLVIFRIVWGFVGSKHALFSSWPFSIKEAISFGRCILHTQKAYASHNPAASLVMYSIIVTLLLLSITGILAYGVQEGKGVLGFLNLTLSTDMELFVEAHEIFSSLLLLFVGMHISGVLIDTFLHPEHRTLRSIIDGYKHLEAESVRLTLLQKCVAAVGLSAVLLTVIFAATTQSKLTKSIYSQVDYEKEHPLFAEECASCHMLYPPRLLPRKSWQLLMSNLKHHFGDDASLETEEEKAITAYLLKYAAESSTQESSVYILKSFPKKDIIAITETPYWKKRHKEIPPPIFKSEKILSRANCKACHGDVEKGLIEDIKIKIPES